MDSVATITMPVDEAKQKYDEYRAGLAGREPSEEDKGILIGYKALAAGKAVLNLTDVIRNGGAGERGLPKLAAARAHWRWCHIDRNSTGSGMFMEERVGRGRPAWHRRILFGLGTFAPPPADDWRFARSRALVPLIPPNLRPARALERYVILFEAEWQPVPPVDPILLRHLHGDLYAVLAAWNLTSLERAVLAGRFNEDRP